MSVKLPEILIEGPAPAKDSFSLSTNLVWSSIFIMEGSIHLPHVLKFQKKRKFEVRASCELTPKLSKPFTLVYTAWKHAKLGEKRLARCSKIWNIARLQYPVSVLVVRHRYIKYEQKWRTILPGLAIISYISLPPKSFLFHWLDADKHCKI